MELNSYTHINISFFLHYTLLWLANEQRTEQSWVTQKLLKTKTIKYSFWFSEEFMPECGL